MKLSEYDNISVIECIKTGSILISLKTEEHHWNDEDVQRELQSIMGVYYIDNGLSCPIRILKENNQAFIQLGEVVEKYNIYFFAGSPKIPYYSIPIVVRDLKDAFDEITIKGK